MNASGVNWQLGLLDFSACEMVLVLKLISVAVARQDAWQAKNRGKVRGWVGGWVGAKSRGARCVGGSCLVYACS